MRRTALAALCALTVAACGSSSSDPTTTEVSLSLPVQTTAPVDIETVEVAAVVDGVEILASQLLATTVEGADPGDIAEALRRLILNQVLEAAAADFGIVLTDEDLETSRAQIVNEVTAGGSVELDDVMESASLTEEAFDLIVRQTALADAIDVWLAENAPPPRDDDLEELYDDVIWDRTIVCSAHILLDTAAEAEAALERALAGEDFAGLAQELSTGPSGPSGGDLGCLTPTDFVGPFAFAVMDAPVGEPIGPVETEFGFHVVLVTSRDKPTLDDMRAELTQMLVGEVFPVWLVAQVEAADISVDPAFGTWTTDPSPGVIPVS